MGLFTPSHLLLQMLVVHPPCAGPGGAGYRKSGRLRAAVGRGTRPVPPGPRQQASKPLLCGWRPRHRVGLCVAVVLSPRLTWNEYTFPALLPSCSAVCTQPTAFPSVARGPSRLCSGTGLLGALGCLMKLALQPAAPGGQAGSDDEDTDVPGGSLPASVSHLLVGLSMGSARCPGVSKSGQVTR